MSHIDNHDIVADREAVDDIENQVGLEAAIRNDDADFQPFLIVDFDISHWARALFCVPLKRARGIATLWDGTETCEKKLDDSFLTLKERIEFRRRVFMITPTLISFPKWDIDGPDIHFFAQKGRVNSKDLKVGPWMLDGRKLVADAKDTALMIAEAMRRAGKSSIQIINPYSTNFVTQRGWSVGKGLFYCFWSGVRKAAECVPDITFIAISDTNPYPFYECAVLWKPLAEGLVACPSDAFACLGSTETEAPFFDDKVSASISKFILQNEVSRASLCLLHRNQFWDPSDVLNLLKYKTK